PEGENGEIDELIEPPTFAPKRVVKRAATPSILVDEEQLTPPPMAVPLPPPKAPTPPVPAPVVAAPASEVVQVVQVDPVPAPPAPPAAARQEPTPAHRAPADEEPGGPAVVGDGPCRIAVVTTPAGSTIQLDGKTLGPSPLTLASTCEKHRVDIAHPRYETTTRWVNPTQD